MPATAHRCYSKAFFSLYLIGQQSGLAKAKPLTMHNKTLIWTLCLGRHRRLVKASPCERRRAPPEQTARPCRKFAADRPGALSSPGGSTRKSGPFPPFL